MFKLKARIDIYNGLTLMFEQGKTYYAEPIEDCNYMIKDKSEISRIVSGDTINQKFKRLLK